MRVISHLCIVLALSACASGPLQQTGTFLPPEHERQLADAQLCCSSYKQFGFEKLKAGEERPFTLVPGSPVFEFPHGRSFFAAYELPVGARTLAVKTEPVDMLWNAVGHVLIPAVVFLDEKQELIGIARPTYKPRSPRIIGDSWAEASLPIVSRAKFAVIVDARSKETLAWRDRDQSSGYLYVRSGPSGMGSIVASGN